MIARLIWCLRLPVRGLVSLLRARRQLSIIGVQVVVGAAAYAMGLEFGWWALPAAVLLGIVTGYGVVALFFPPPGTHP